MEQIEDNDYQAESFSVVTSVLDVSEERLAATVDKSGVVRVKTAAKEIALPDGPEALRRRLRTYGYSWMYARLRHPGRQLLATFTLQLMYDYTDYLLGEEVFLLHAKDEHGKAVTMPAWGLVISYDREIRRSAARQLQRGIDIDTAFRAAWTDPKLHARYFTTPLAVAAVSRSTDAGSSATRAAPYPPAERVPPWDKPWNEWHAGAPKAKAGGKKGKGAGKGGGKKGGGKKGKQDRGKTAARGHSLTPDGRQICFLFNRPEGCGGQCGRVHVCQGCMASGHTWANCPGQAAPAPLVVVQ
jgi:hypothetical protein